MGYIPVATGAPSVFVLIFMVRFVARGLAGPVIRPVSAVIARTHASSQSTVVQLGNLGLHRFEISVVRRCKFIETVMVQRQTVRRVGTQRGRHFVNHKLLHHHLAQHNSI